MVTTHNEKTMPDDEQYDLVHLMKEEVNAPSFTLSKNTALDKNLTQTLLQSQFITHNPKAGLNPLVDAAAYLFSTIGKLKQLKSYRNLAKLQKELISEMNVFQEAAKSQGYSSEYILVSRYALCATIDETIANTSWGNQGQWDAYNILAEFTQESVQADGFFLILERIIKDPALYIDVMELMYICLSLGYKGSYRFNEVDSSSHSLENITHSLYKRIRAHHGEYSKTLSPFPIRAPRSVKLPAPKLSYFVTFFISASIIMLVFIGLGYLLDTISNQAYQELMHIGKSILYGSFT